MCVWPECCSVYRGAVWGQHRSLRTHDSALLHFLSWHKLYSVLLSLREGPSVASRFTSEEAGYYGSQVYPTVQTAATCTDGSLEAHWEYTTLTHSHAADKPVKNVGNEPHGHPPPAAPRRWPAIKPLLSGLLCTRAAHAMPSLTLHYRNVVMYYFLSNKLYTFISLTKHTAVMCKA